MRTRTVTKKILISSMLAAFSFLMLLGLNPAVASDKVPMGKITPDRTRLWSPGKLAVGPEGTLYVVDAYKNRVQKFDAKGTFLGSIRVIRPAAVAASPNGNVYIGSYNGYSVVIYRNDELTGYLGAGQHEFSSINDIVVDKSTGDVYVVDSKEKAVKIYFPTGAAKGKIGGFVAPTAAAVTDKAVIVLDGPIVPCPSTITVKGQEIPCPECTGPCSGTRISVIDKAGVPVRNILEADANTGIMLRPVALASDTLGNIYVADSMSQTVLVYDPNLSFVGEFASVQHDLHAPIALALSADNNLYVSSSATRSVVEIGLSSILHTTQAGSLNFQTKAGAGLSLSVLGY